jgi:hypothetical protein
MKTKDSESIRLCADAVEKLAAYFVGNSKVDGGRDSAVYEQGIGCERAAKMLREMAILVDKENATT